MLESPEKNGNQIAKSLKMHAQTVNRVLKNYKENLTIERKTRTTKKKRRKTSKLAAKILVYYKSNPGISGRSLARKLSCSESYIRKVRKIHNLGSFRVKKVPHRTNTQLKIARFRARKLYEGLLKKLRQNCGCVLMDDETYLKFSLRQMPGRNYYVSKIRGQVDPRFKYIQCDKFAKKAMIWQAICTCGMTSSSFITMSTMRSENYLKDCLKKGILPKQSSSGSKLKAFNMCQRTAIHQIAQNFTQSKKFGQIASERVVPR